MARRTAGLLALSRLLRHQRRYAGSNVSTNSAVGSFATVANPQPSLHTDEEIASTPMSEAIALNDEDAVRGRFERLDPFSIKMTTLPGNLRVVSTQTAGEYCTIGVGVDAGSRHEAGFRTPGITHFLEKLGFASTLTYEDTAKLHEAIDGLYAVVDCRGTRDMIAYAGTCPKHNMDPLMNIMAETSLRPRLVPNEIETARETVVYDIDCHATDPKPDNLLLEWIHLAAFRDNTLGLPRLTPLDEIQSMSRETLISFLKTYYTPSRLVVAGVGVNHEDLVETAQRYFLDTPPVWEKTDEQLNRLVGTLPKVAQDVQIAEYTGGDLRVKADLSSVALGLTPKPELVHFVLGLEACSFNDPDYVPFCVLNSILGGGEAFSQGGPGKGMYARLYSDVMFRYSWMYQAASYCLSYADSGLFCIHVSGPPRNDASTVMVQAVIDQLLKLCPQRTDLPLVEEELARAKRRLSSTLLMNLEMRSHLLEDLIRQTFGFGEAKSPIHYVEQIEKVTIADIHRVVERMLSSAASVVAYGKVEAIPDWSNIDLAISRRDVSLVRSSRYKFF